MYVSFFIYVINKINILLLPKYLNKKGHLKYFTYQFKSYITISKTKRLYVELFISALNGIFNFAYFLILK